MKKILFLSMIAVAISFASCGNKTSDNAAEADSAAVATEATESEVAAGTVFEQLQAAASDPAKLQLALGTAQAKIQELLESGNAESVKAYTDKLMELINSNETVKNALANAKGVVSTGSVMDALTSVVGAATQEGATASSFLEATKKAGTNALTEKAIEAASAVAAGEAGAEAVGNAVDAAKTAVENAPEAVKDAAAGAVESAKEKANNKVEEAKTKANNAVENAKAKATEAASNAAAGAVNKAAGKLGL